MGDWVSGEVTGNEKSSNRDTGCAAGLQPNLFNKCCEYLSTVCQALYSRLWGYSSEHGKDLNSWNLQSVGKTDHKPGKKKREREREER